MSVVFSCYADLEDLFSDGGTAYEWCQIICFPESFSKMSDWYIFPSNSF